MKTPVVATRHLSPALFCGLAAFAFAMGLGFFDLRLAAVPLTLFVIACLAAPFLPWLGFFLPVISKGSTGKPMVALTFDDGPDPASTEPLLALLEQSRIRATFFVTGEKAEKYPELVEAILARGHTVGNHSYRHSYLALIRGPQALHREIAGTQEAMAHFGIRPLAYRPPVGITTPGLDRVLGRLGMYTVNFRFRTLDRGNRHLRNLARNTLARIRPDDILALHDLNPDHDRGVDRWLVEVKRIVAGLGKQGLAIVPLETLIGRPVMKRTG